MDPSSQNHYENIEITRERIKGSKFLRSVSISGTHRRRFKTVCLFFVLFLSIALNIVLSIFLLWAIGLIRHPAPFLEDKPIDQPLKSSDRCSKPLSDSHLCIPCKVIGQKHRLTGVKRQIIEHENDRDYELCCIDDSRQLVELLKIMKIAKLSSTTTTSIWKDHYLRLSVKGEQGSLKLHAEEESETTKLPFINNAVRIEEGSWYFLQLYFTVLNEIGQQRPYSLEVMLEKRRDENYSSLMKKEGTIESGTFSYQVLTMRNIVYLERGTSLRFKWNTSNMTYINRYCTGIQMFLIPYNAKKIT